MDTQNCDCCEGTRPLTPANVANRPGLSALTYRVGTHARFLETMKARLSNMAISNPDGSSSAPAYPLAALTTRAGSDPAIALLDSWATVADVLTFYQERIANEGFLGTATERRSVLELARLIGYALRPGVSASAYLALDLDKDHEVTIKPFEVRAQSVPGPGELPQTFENNESLEARYSWNRLKPRLHKPQTLAGIQKGDALGNIQLYLKGISTNLKKNDVMLLTGSGQQAVYHVASVTPDAANDRSLVTFQEKAAAFATAMPFDGAAMVEVAKNYIQAKPAERRKVPTEMAARVVTHLQTLVEKIQDPVINRADSIQVMNETLTRLSEEHAMAVGNQYSKLSTWLGGMIEDLRTTHRGLSAGQTAFMAQTPASAADPAQAKIDPFLADPLLNALSDLARPGSIPPRNTLNLARNLGGAFSRSADTGLKINAIFNTRLGKTIADTLANVKVMPDSDLRAYAFRASARPFGHNAQPRAIINTGEPTSYQEWTINDPLGTGEVLVEGPAVVAGDAANALPLYHAADLLYLDNEYKVLSNDGWVIVDGPAVNSDPLILNLASGDAQVAQSSLAAYGISAKTTRLNLKNGYRWLDANSTFDAVRASLVYAESEELSLAEQPVEEPVCDGSSTLIELDGLYSGMQSGRWLIISGERSDISTTNNQPVTSVLASELVMLAEVIQDVTTEAGQPYYYNRQSTGVGNIGGANGPVQSPPLANDKPHTWIRLARPLEYCYRRESVNIFGNVVRATHGETHNELLGNGDASLAFQTFTLKQSPLTYTSSPTPAGAESSLKIYVNDVRWAESPNLVGQAATDRIFTTKTDDNAKTSAIFGNGKSGARLPTGSGNLRAEYRSGIGQPGNVSAGQINLLMAKPLGVQAVLNPLRASGGADRETMETARKNAPRTVTALDRLVSVSDYADFSRTFAGVGKSSAYRRVYQGRSVIQVTIAGADDIPIDESSDLYKNLLLALRNYGDPDVPVILQVRDLIILTFSANIKILSDHLWDPVVQAVRAKLYEVFGFERRELGQDIILSEVITAIQSVPGVDYVDVDLVGYIPEKRSEMVGGKLIRRLLTPQEISDLVQSQINPSRLVGQVVEKGLTGIQQARYNLLLQPIQRVPISRYGGVRGGVLFPDALAYLSSGVSDTLILNQVK